MFVRTVCGTTGYGSLLYLYVWACLYADLVWTNCGTNWIHIAAASLHESLPAHWSCGPYICSTNLDTDRYCISAWKLGRTLVLWTICGRNWIRTRFCIYACGSVLASWWPFSTIPSMSWVGSETIVLSWFWIQIVINWRCCVKIVAETFDTGQNTKVANALCQKSHVTASNIRYILGSSHLIIRHILLSLLT